MKYIIITKAIDKTKLEKGTIWKANDGENQKAFQVEIVKQVIKKFQWTSMFVYKKGTIQSGDKTIGNWRDITPIFDKLNLLVNALINENKKITVPEIDSVESIRTAFLLGKYPTRTNFKYMNEIWEKIK